jgi:hypothetical protein
MRARLLAVFSAATIFSAGAFSTGAWAQTVCPSTPQYSPCDLTFNISAARGFQLEGEFRSPAQTTSLAKAFWDGGTRWVIRFSPAEAGSYAYRLNTDLAEFKGKEGQFTATPAASKSGWLRAANVHHFAFVEGKNLTPHLWMGALAANFPELDSAQWKALVDALARDHFNHVGVTLVDEKSAADFKSPEFFHSIEEKLRYANQNGLIVDVAFFGPNRLLDRLLPSRDARSDWFTTAISRLAAFDVTWQGIEAWETYDNGRDLLKEIAGYLTDLDPYKHPRSSRTMAATGALADDGWMRYRSYETGDPAIGAIEQQVYQYPAVDNFGSGAKDSTEFRHRLWNATVNGQYPATLLPNTGDDAIMKIWYEFMEKTRHWELEPFFDSSNGRGLALEGVEYIVYVEKPSGPVSVNIEHRSYDGEWFDPATGASVKIKDMKFKEDQPLTVTPPDAGHDWVLHISREGQKASMLKSYRFDSRPGGIVLQEIEGIPEKVPFDVVAPPEGTISLSNPAAFEIRLNRQTKALERMLYEWTGEVTLDNRGTRVIGTGASGTFQIPPNIARDYPAALHVHLVGINGLGKVYALDRNYTLSK